MLSIAPITSDFKSPPSPVTVSNDSSSVLDLVRLGLSLIPINSREKRPHVRWKRYQRKAATVEQAQQWQHDFPSCNWAAVWGSVSGNIMAVDIDSAPAFGWCQRQGGFNQSPPVWYTTGRGFQYLFRLPSELADTRTIFPSDGVELRTSRCYSIVPPSIHPNGKRYQWGSKPPKTLEDIPDAPQWIVDLLTGETLATNDAKVARVVSPPIEDTPQRHEPVKRESPKAPKARPNRQSKSGMLQTVNPHLLKSSVYQWHTTSHFRKGSRRNAFYNIAVLHKGAGLSRGESQSYLDAWRQGHTLPIYGGPHDADPEEYQRVFAAVWANGYRPTVRQLQTPINSKGQRITKASAITTCRFYPDTRMRTSWNHEPAVLAVFRIIEALARNRVGIKQPQCLTHAQLASLANISEARVMHAAPFLSQLGVRSITRQGRSTTSTYSSQMLRSVSSHTVCRAFVSWIGREGWMPSLWGRLVRRFADVLRRLRDAINAVQFDGVDTSLGEICEALESHAYAVGARGPPATSDAMTAASRLYIMILGKQQAAIAAPQPNAI